MTQTLYSSTWCGMSKPINATQGGLETGHISFFKLMSFPLMLTYIHVRVDTSIRGMGCKIRGQKGSHLHPLCSESLSVFLFDTFMIRICPEWHSWPAQAFMNGPHFTAKITFAVTLFMDEVSLFPLVRLSDHWSI